MRLRAKNSIQGINPDGDYTHAGDVFELADETEARRLIDLDAAEECVAEETKSDTGDIFAIR